MPIEIKELHIKINVNEGAKPTSQASKSNEKDVVEECVEQVMQIIERQKER
jgi:hypothetical protein